MGWPFHFIDLIIYNARLYDPLTGPLSDTALAAGAKTILAMGADQDILGLRQPHTISIDAEGKWLLPAFLDSHTHFLGYVKRQKEVNLFDCRSLPEALERIRKSADETPEGEWITGGGWNRNNWGDQEYPNRRQLDEISTRHFIALESKDWHTLWVNTPVLELAGISVSHPYPNAKHFAVDSATGEFTGVLEEDTRLAVLNLIPPLNYARLRESYLRVVSEFHRLGFSGTHTVETPAEFSVYQEAEREGELGLRFFWYLPIKQMGAAREIAIQHGLGSDFLKICGVKIFVDGAFGSQTAELLEDYLELGHAGVELLSEEALDNDVSRAVEADLACAIHAIGDRAIRKSLRVLGKYHQPSKKSGLRHRIEHAQLIHPDDIPLFQKYDVYASVQPVHLAADIPIIQRYLGERGRYAYPYGSLKRSGAKLIFGSDAPVEHFNPWRAIYTAMERRQDLDPQNSVFYPEQQLDMTICLQGYTCLSAEAAEMEKELGCLAPGYLADFFIPDRDIFQISLPELRETVSRLTVVDGKIVYRDM
ncbi:MAG: amidohydrolase [Calditrichia bacterium]